MLDGKEINETSRQFLKNMQANKEAQKRKRESLSRKSTKQELAYGKGIWLLKRATVSEWIV